MSRGGISRRQFITRAATAAAAITIVPRHVLGGRGFTPPSEVLTRGVIGTGGMGTGGHVRTNEPGQPPRTLAVCDVDKNRLANALKKAGPPCRAYTDFRRLLDEAKDIDVIHVPTPPHWHALISIAAMQAGKDVYCEKPMTRFIHEGRVVVETVKRYGRVMGVNSYGAANNRMRKLVQSGLLGFPVTVRVSRSQGYDWKVKGWSGRTDLTPQPVPPNLDYDMWLGPAPYKPYNKARVHGSFRRYWDYDGGGLTDMGQHWLDEVVYFLGKEDTDPVEVEAYAPWPPHPDAVGMWGRLSARYADGTTIIIESGEWGEPEPGEHAFVEGPKGKVYRRPKKTEPEDLFDQLGPYPDPPRPIGFDEAVRTRRQPTAKPDAELSHRTCKLLHLCNIAIRTGRKVHWDPLAERIVGDEEANRFVDIPMRAPWHL